MNDKILTEEEFLAILVAEYGVENIDVSSPNEIERMISTLSDKEVIRFDYDVIENSGSSWQQVCVYSQDLGKMITEHRKQTGGVFEKACYGKTIILDGDALGEFDDIDSFIKQIISWEIETRELLGAMDRFANYISE